MTCADKEWNWAHLGEWNYATNRENIYKFWQDGTQARKNYESIITLGMRGQADTSILGENATLKDNMDLMQKVLTDQREIIENVHGKADAAPQMIALYKEVEAFYYGDETGKLHVPDDVTLMLCDDNFGNLRTLPTPEMLKRPGGFGMYYHFDYRGGPISYEWINQTPLPKVWDNMTNAYEAGIRQIWIVNVGDLKPMELPLDYFMSLAYDYETWKQPNKTHEFTRGWAAREFGEAFADGTAEVISEYLKILGARKAEVVLKDTFSLTNFDEANRVLANYEPIVKKAEEIYEKLPQHKKAVFYQMVLYPARAALNTYKTNIYTAWNNYLAEKSCPKANGYKQLAIEAFNQDATDMEYYNTELSNGKWDGIMRQNHMGYTTWDGPKIHVVPEVLPQLYTVGNDASLQKEKPADTYIQEHGYISINPSQYVKNNGWLMIENYGREFDSVKAVSADAILEYTFFVQNPGKYVANIFLAPTNNPYHETVKPPEEQLRFAVSLNNNAPITTSALPKGYEVGDSTWAQGVINNIRVIPVPAGELVQGLHSLKLHAIDTGVVIEKIVIAPPEARQKTISTAPPTQHFMGAYFGPPESRRT